MSGSIKDTATEVEDIAFYLANHLLQHYPQLLAQRYELDSVPDSDIELLERIGARRGCLRSGGHIDLEKVSTILVNEYRGGQLGRITLETPDMVLAEEKIVREKKREKAEREKQRKRKKSES